MKPIFSIHAGEYLVGNILEKKFPNCEIWLPSKDTGTDLLLTNREDRSKNVGIQVKFSKDFLPEMNMQFSQKLVSCGWWTLNYNKIINSNADLWILAPYSFKNKNVQLVIIEPKVLAKRLKAIHGHPKSMNTYLWVTNDNKCYETRGLKKKEQHEVVNGNVENISKQRIFSKYLNAWDKINTFII